MTLYDSEAMCGSLKCQVLSYAYDSSEPNTPPPCPACEAREERDRNKRAAVTLGKIVDRQCRDVLDATGMHHVIGEDGDGDWALVWERLAEMGAFIKAIDEPPNESKP